MVLGFIVFTFLLFVVLRIFRTRRKSGTIAFFHPYCEGGGGGERVLYQAIDALITSRDKCKFGFTHVAVYCRDTGSTDEQILEASKRRFDIALNTDNKDVTVEFVRLKSVGLMDPKNYPRFTLLLQCLGELAVGCEGIFRLLPDVFIDTTGCPLTLPLFRWVGGCRVTCYVHYPTITRSMIRRVGDGVATYNNASFISRSAILTYGKIAYYYLFSLMYWLCGLSAHVVMTNGSWTTAHISDLWPCAPYRVYPPVDVNKFPGGKVTRSRSPAAILAVGQIRPEKNHRLQIDTLKLLLDAGQNVVLIIAGGCRNADDKERVTQLQDYAERNGVADHIQWKLNVPLPELVELNHTSLVGIHTMIDEHFGIAVVENMSAGLMMVAHNSAGPRQDIVENGVTGFLATTAEEYAECITEILKKTDAELDQIREAATKSVQRFSGDAFNRDFIAALNKL
uniref:GDP-Man:Man(3)GlcNAc(2)-PP-Dol alpha-1,2-mannosyltransferase n=1 Tax=Panagrellus redivivus TaxID=6233 RepID=A0A7E4UW91_PANRE